MSFAPIRLTYDGVDLQAVGLQIFLELDGGLGSGGVRGSDTIVPALAGRSAGSRVNDMTDVRLAGWVAADPLSAYVEAVRSLFASNRARAPLVATLEDGSIATIMARPMPGSPRWSPSPAGPGSALVSIALEGNGDWVITPPVGRAFDAGGFESTAFAVGG